MATRDKTFTPDQLYFITFTICKWQKIFTERKYIDLIYKWFDYQKKEYQNLIHGYVIMPNHFHGLIHISPKSAPLPKLIQNGKRFLAYEIVKYLKADEKEDILEIFRENARTEKNAQHRVFEDRYDAKLIDNGEMFYQKLEYIHHNPLQEHWQLAKLPEEYPHSSAANYILGKGVYSVDLLDWS